MTSETDAVIRLPWDSSNFGFEVATIGVSDLDDNQLKKTIRSARARKFALIYWVTKADRILSEDLLGQLGGQLVDHKVTYARALHESTLRPESGSEGSAGDLFRVETIPRGPASEQLIALAIDAARFSRYRKESRFPAHLTERMYTTWIERSARRELADTVLAVVSEHGDTLGMITVSKKEHTCQVGLLSVDASVRRAGLGRLLLSAAHEWSIAQDVFQSAIVTQADNVAACRLCERCGYHIHESCYVYHFWLQ